MKIEFTRIEKMNSQIDDQIIEDILHPGIALLYGQAKSFKSIFATSLSKSISDVLIQYFVRRSINKHGNVIYFALDDRDETIASRFNDLENISLLNWKDYKKYCTNIKNELLDRNMIVENGTAMFSALLNEIVNENDISPVLVVVDTWEKIRAQRHQTYYGDEVKEIETIRKALQENDKLKNTCVLLVHHSTKANDTYQGSAGVAAEVDIIMHLKSIGEYERLLEVESNSMPKQSIPITIDPGKIEVNYSENGIQVINDDEMRKLLEWCYSEKRPKAQYPIIYQGTYEELMYSARLNYENSKVFANKLRDNEDLLLQEGIMLERIRTSKSRVIRLTKLLEEDKGGN